MASIVERISFGGTTAKAAGVDAGSVTGKVAAFPCRPGAPDYAGMLSAIRAGDQQAEDQLMRALRAPLEVVLRHRARHAEGVDDLCQDALIVVLRAAREGRIDDPVALVEYALQTARQLALNAERKRSRRQTYSSGEALEPAGETALDASESLAGEQVQKCIGEVLAALPNARDRELLHSYYLRETSTSELQSQLSMDSAQLGKVLHRARQRFGQMWRSLQFDVPQQ
jgi:RNA polymerase sigma factor (sigma-70 family)